MNLLHFHGLHRAMFLRVLPPCLILSSLGIIGCSRAGDGPEGHTFRRYQEEGVTVAHSSGTPKYEGELFRYESRLELQEDERVASTLLLGSPPWIDEEGNYYVADQTPSDFPSVARIAVFDSTGRFRYAFGRPGEGPGEFRHPRITRLSGGEIDVMDVGGYRLHRFTTDGRLIETITFPRTSTTFSVGLVVRLPAGGYAGIGSPVRFSRNDLPKEGERRDDLRRVTGYSTAWDSLWSLETGIVPGPKVILISRGEMNLYTTAPTPFAPLPQVAYGERLGFLLTTGREPVLDGYDEAGQHRLRIRIDLPLRPVTESDREREADALRRQMEAATGLDRELLKEQLQQIEYPPAKAFWAEEGRNGIQFDESGFIWIRLPKWATEGEEVPPEGGAVEGPLRRYLVLSPEGEYLGITTTPARGDCRITRGQMVSLERDPETQAPHVVAWRIRPVVPGLGEYPPRP
jgi:hypothetical protein